MAKHSGAGAGAPIPVTFTDQNGGTVSRVLTRAEAEALATALFVQLAADQVDTDDHLVEQSPLMTMSNPVFEFGWIDDLDLVVAMGLRGMRPIFVKLRRDHAIVVSTLLMHALDESGPAESDPVRETGLFPAAAARVARADTAAARRMRDSLVGPGIVALTDEDGRVRPLADIEAEVIRFALRVFGGDRSRAARHLGIGRTTVYRKLADIGEASAPSLDEEVV